MSLILRSLRTGTFGFGSQYVRNLTSRELFTIPSAIENREDLLAAVREYVTDGYMQVVTADATHGLAPVRLDTSRNKMTLTIGVGGTVAFPRVANSHTLTLGGVAFTLAEPNATVSATSVLAAFLADLAASEAFAATGAVVDSSGILDTPVDTQATGVLTFTDNPSDGDTATIGTQVYTFKTALTASGVTAGEVLIGATASDTLDNLVAAINGAAGGATTYGSATVTNTLVTAAAGAGDTIDLTAIEAGVVGNSVVTTETFTAVGNVFDAAVLENGLDGRAYVVLDGSAVAPAAWDTFVAASSVVAVGTELITIESETATTTDTSNANLPVQVNYTVVAADVTRGFLELETGLTDLTNNFAISIRRAGALVAHDGTVSVKGASNVLVSNDGAVDFAAGDVITLFAAGTD